MNSEGQSRIETAMSTRSPSRRRFLKWVAGSSLMLAGSGSYARWMEPNRLTVVRQSVSLAGWPANRAVSRIGHLSDFHCDSDRAVERTTESVRLLLAEKPDIVFLTGDYITVHPRRWSAACADALAPLASVSGGAFAVLGNHDWWAGDPDEVERQLTRAGIRVLRNEAAPLNDERTMFVVGLDDRCVNKQQPAQALRNVPADALRLLLIHEPDYADEAPPGFALQLSGHSHGGQIRVPGLPPLHTPKYGRRYPEGLQRGKSHLVYTTRGVGVIGPKFRFCCPPEVTLLQIVPRDARNESR